MALADVDNVLFVSCHQSVRTVDFAQCSEIVRQIEFMDLEILYRILHADQRPMSVLQALLVASGNNCNV